MNKCPDSFRSQFDVSRETIERLELFVALLLKWQDKINLIAPSTIPDLWNRHVADSAQIWGYRKKNARYWTDFGSGAGLPGLVVSILAAESSPNVSVSLIESDSRKSVFLQTVIRELSLNASVRSVRIESEADAKADHISARALAPLSQLLAYAHQYIVEDGICLFHKGVNAENEVNDARTSWRFNVSYKPSIVQPDSTILLISDIQHAG